MSFNLPNQLNEKQMEKLKSIFKLVELMREEVKEYGDDCELADGRADLVSLVEELYLMFSKERKTYL